jgi:hypothetical protein
MDASKAKKEASEVKISFFQVNRIHRYNPNRYPDAPYPSSFIPVNSFFVTKILGLVSMIPTLRTLPKNSAAVLR